ncbi:hypothetical protein Bca52824_046227 [Brassica carinata]|uniref:UBX domain-containing protein n=1 Tax=Brassica carinata TaxID=52824 RepID=A0A8X7RGR2_BRACI|nr:hypothetical protein Bca52824_046227 [Brassica carinata]
MGDDDHKPPPTTEEIRQNMICWITSSSEQVAILILEAHQWDIAAAVSAFRDAVVAAAAAAAAARPNVPSPIRLRSPRSPSRVFSPRSARNPFSREAMERDGNILSDSDEKENEDPMESDDVERDLSSLPRRLKFRSLSEILSVIPQEIPRTVTLYRNGYTFDDDNILWPLDDPQCAEFLEDSSNSFQGVGRTLAEPDSVPPASSDSLTTEATPSMNPTAPTTSIKVILADGTPIVSRFTTTHHTIRDVRDFIDAARPDASRDYQLLIMGSSAPKLLTTDLDQTIDQAGISNSVLTLKF